jgi:hypothetical protein
MTDVGTDECKLALAAISVPDASVARAPDDTKELVSLCRTGRLYDIEKWIAAGKPLDIPTKYGSLLQVAVQTGFHSLIELIAKHEKNQSSKDAALADAVSLRRLDFIQLLLENGAEVKSVPFSDVLLEWNPHIFRFFLERGADPVEGSPFAIAFSSKIRTGLGAFVELKRSRPERRPTSSNGSRRASPTEAYFLVESIAGVSHFDFCMGLDYF